VNIEDYGFSLSRREEESRGEGEGEEEGDEERGELLYDTGREEE
jgi:hypothetical protein